MGFLFTPPRANAVRIAVAEPAPGWLAKLWARFIEDCRDFRLWMKGIEPRDEYLAYEMMAEMAKIPENDFDIDAWEAERFAAHPNAVWFDPDRYKDTPYDWVKKPKPKKVELPKQVYDPLTDMMRNVPNPYGGLNQLAALQNQYAAIGQLGSASYQQQAKMLQAQYGIMDTDFFRST